jgi:WD40 repeat protein
MTRREGRASPAEVTEDARDASTSAVSTVAGPAGNTASDVLPVVPLGVYEMEGELARGGLGRVMKARDTRIGRVVAVKMLLESRPDLRARFVREALVTARLEHPSVVPVYEAGVTPEGEPFYAMKLVSGQPLSARLRAASSFAERLALLPHVLAVAEAMAYVHSKRVIHRDLKPANVIVGDFGETMIIDWGIAKVLGEDDAGPAPAARIADDASLTLAGSVVGTPKYMAPEQALGEALDERADVYAIGAVLYAVLGGRSPYAGESETVLRSVMVGPPVPLEQVEPSVPTDLAAIVAKAMAREVDQRYPSAKELAADLRRFTAGQLVGAHRYSPWALVRRWVKQHRPHLGIAAVALVVLVAGGAISVARVLRERAEAVRAEKVAEARRDELLLLQARASLPRDPTATVAWLKQVPLDAAHAGEMRALLVDAESRGIASHVWRPGRGSVQAVAFSPDGRALAVGGSDQVIHVRDLDGGAPRALRGLAGPVNALAYSPDGAWLASASDDHSVALWDARAAAPEPRVLGRHDDVATVVAFSPDGRTLASAGGDGKVRLWDVATGAVRVLAGHTLAVWGLAFSPDGATVASGSHDKTVRLWPVAGGEARVFHGPDAMGQLAFAPDGRWLAVVGESTVFRFDVADGTSRPLAKLPTYVVGVAFSPDGATVATVGGDELVRLWDVATGHAHPLFGHEGSLEKVAFSPKGDRLATVGVDGSARVWPLAAPTSRVLGAAGTGVWRPVVSPDGALVAAGGDDGVVRVWDVASGRLTELRGHEGHVRYVAFAPDGRWLASTGDDRTTRLWDLATREGRVLRTGAAGSVRLAVSRDGRRLAVTDGYESLTVLGLDGAAVCVFPGTDVGAAAFDPSGDRIVYESGPEVRAGSLRDCTSTRLYAHAARMMTLAFSADGAHVASAGLDRAVGLWDTRAEHGALLAGHDMEVLTVAFSPDSRVLASASFDKTLRLWDAATGAPLRTLRGPDKGMRSIAFLHDGARIAAASLDNTVRLWDPTSDDARILREHDARITGLDVSPDDRWLVTADTAGFVRVWPLDPRGATRIPADAAALGAWMNAATTARIDADDLPSTP